MMPVLPDLVNSKKPLYRTYSSISPQISCACCYMNASYRHYIKPPEYKKSKIIGPISTACDTGNPIETHLLGLANTMLDSSKFPNPRPHSSIVSKVPILLLELTPLPLPSPLLSTSVSPPSRPKSIPNIAVCKSLARSGRELYSLSHSWNSSP